MIFLLRILVIAGVVMFVLFLSRRMKQKKMRMKDVFPDIKNDRVSVKGGPVLQKPTHRKNLRTCDRILGKIKPMLTSKEMKKQFSGLYNELKKQLQSGRALVNKVDSLYKLLKTDEWNFTRVDRQIRRLMSQSSPDSVLVTTLEQQKDNIVKMTRKVNQLQDEIAAMSIQFNTIYTKLTLLDIEDTGGVDEMESEIQRILDRELAVSKYENEIDRELNDLL